MIHKLLFFLTIILTIPVFPQISNKSKAAALLDSVKIYYGDTCNVGINSNLITELYKYKNISFVRAYLKNYNEIHKKIIEFRKSYFNLITKQDGMILDLARIFKLKKQQNIANACGIYLGPDSVTSIGLSYIITRSAVKNFFFTIIHFINFDPIFKEELLRNGKDWYYSLKLRYLKDGPLKIH